MVVKMKTKLTINNISSIYKTHEIIICSKAKFALMIFFGLIAEELYQENVKYNSLDCLNKLLFVK